MTTDLLTRLEAAKEGSRELDAGIWLFAMHGEAGEIGELKGYDPWDDERGWTIGTHGVWEHELPHYTTSLDAITELKKRELPGWKWTVDEDGLVLMWNRKPYPESRELDVLRGKPPALALCIAFVKAKEAGENEKP